MNSAHSETTADVRRALGAVLRQRREATERVLTEVAAAAEMSPAFLSEVERGRKDISTERLVSLASALDTTIGEVFLALARQLGAGEPLNAVAWEADPKLQLRRMSQALNPDALRTVARFTTFLAMTEAPSSRRPIGFLR